ncbi:MAG: hypothetical protein IPL79_16845 [Myxococcales bacterium]|nr:hypothetical protein [Myxococcales bacterium]
MTRPENFLSLFAGLATSIAFGCASRKAMQPQAAMATAAAPLAMAMDAPEGAPAGGVVTVNSSDEMRTTGEIVVRSPDLLTQSAMFRSEIYARGGTVVNEDIKFTQAKSVQELRTFASPARSNYARFTVTLPASSTAGLLQWIVQHHEIIHQAISAIQLVPAAGPQIATDGEAPPPVHNVSFVVTFVEEVRREAFDEASISLSVRGVGMVTDALDRPANRDTRSGVGLGLRFGNFTIETTGIFATEASSAGIIVTAGNVVYARTMGKGARTAMNPYLQIKSGYAYLNGSAYVLGAELGIELIKAGGVALAASVSPLGLLGKHSMVAVQGGAELRVAF